MMSNLSISNKLWVAFGAIIAVTAIAATVIFFETSGVISSIEDASDRSEELEQIQDWRITVDKSHNVLQSFINSGDYALAEAVDKAFQQSASVYETMMAEIADRPALVAQVEAIASLVAQWRNDVATPQLTELTDPLTYDMARLREMSPENIAMWREIGERFQSMVTETQGALAVSRETQLRDLLALEIVSLGSSVLVLAMSIGMAIMMRNSISVPVRRLAETTGRLKDHDWSVEIVGAERGDEIGEMARALKVFRDDGEQKEKVDAERVREAEEKARRAEEVAEAITGFRGRSASLLAQLSQAGSQLDGAATSLDEVAGASYTYTQTVNDSASATGHSVRSVAAAVEEMTASIQDISSQLHNVSQLTQTTTDATDSASSKVAGLKSRSDEIHEVVDLINGIAGQINLLALNATIEAARAGDAGKGFAVVAHEVKQLATETAKATEDIARVIGQVSSDVDEVVGAISVISGSIADVNANAAAVSAAVEEQSAALGEISRNVNEVSEQTNGVATNVKGVETKVGETREVAANVNELSRALQASSRDLRGSIDAFIGAVANDDSGTRSAV